jgi:hypothetical protein
MNIELLQKTQEWIKAHPKNFSMRSWVNGKDLEGNQIYPYGPAEMPVRPETTLCINAIAAAIWNTTERKENESLAIYASGMDLLGIESSLEWQKLVLLSCWPYDLGMRYTGNAEERAAAAVERIQRLIDSQVVPA